NLYVTNETFGIDQRARLSIKVAMGAPKSYGGHDTRNKSWRVVLDVHRLGRGPADGAGRVGGLEMEAARSQGAEPPEGAVRLKFDRAALDGAGDQPHGDRVVGRSAKGNVSREENGELQVARLVGERDRAVVGAEGARAEGDGHVADDVGVAE